MISHERILRTYMRRKVIIITASTCFLTQKCYVHLVKTYIYLNWIYFKRCLFRCCAIIVCLLCIVRMCRERNTTVESRVAGWVVSVASVDGIRLTLGSPLMCLCKCVYTRRHTNKAKTPRPWCCAVCFDDDNDNDNHRIIGWWSMARDTSTIFAHQYYMQ